MNVTDPVNDSATIIAGSQYYVGTDFKIAQASWAANGTFAGSSLFGSSVIGPFLGVAFDGAKFYAASKTAAVGSTFAFDSALAQSWASANYGSSANGTPVILAAGAGVVLPTADKKVHTLSPNNGSEIGTPPVLTKAAFTPLVASDGKLYVGTATGNGVVEMTTGGVVEWTVNGGITGSTSVPPTMSCSGVLYTAAVDRVYAVITDAAGLANTPWPKYQRDTRNSGNADAATKWGVRTAPGTCVQ